MVVLEVRIDVGLPIELIHEVIEVLVLLGRDVFDQKRPRHLASFDQRLIHPEDVASPLWLVGHKRTRGVQQAGSHEPSRSGLEPIGLGVVQDSVVAVVPSLQAAPDVSLARPRLEAEERVRKVVADAVELGREVIRFRLAFLPDKRCLLGALMHVMGDRPHVVEELAVDRPLAVLFPDIEPDDSSAQSAHGIFQRKTLAVVDHVAQAFVRRRALVCGGRGRAEPSLVDAAPVGSERVVIVGMQLDPATRMQEGARNPVRGQTQNSLAGLQSARRPLLDFVSLDGLECHQ